LICLTPFAPHISAELWQLIGNETSILDASFPNVDESYLIEQSFLYPIAIQGKARTEMEFAIDGKGENDQCSSVTYF
jgi:leucyl-tRNA synthetase